MGLLDTVRPIFFSLVLLAGDHRVRDRDRHNHHPRHDGISE